MLSHISDEGESELDSDSTVAWERVYLQGVLMAERVKNNAGLIIIQKQTAEQTSCRRSEEYQAIPIVQCSTYMSTPEIKNGFGGYHGCLTGLKDDVIIGASKLASDNEDDVSGHGSVSVVMDQATRVVDLPPRKTALDHCLQPLTTMYHHRWSQEILK
ncbi:hypothetical protein L1987_86119 [Smallanthus sonchifolius]|uniref:Uncharacterized protein n=1 Tax=Smallanthus sonchifolius TaxID=185202 RepID=A0ACB8XXQ6_9ASTR|nr:hypothetical protein L1987_86119 [Smallanthus sonchifolius]